MTKVSVVVYGPMSYHASCVNAPTSINTFEWIKPLLEESIQTFNLNTHTLIFKIKQII